MAIFFVAEFGTKDEVAKLDSLLEDTTSIGSAGVNWTTLHAQVRDVVLGVKLFQAGQPLGDFGFVYFQIIPNLTPFQTSPSCMGFTDDNARAAAFKKWKEWQDKQKK